MQPRNAVKQAPKAPRVRKEAPKPRLRIVRLEARIAPVRCPAWICGSGNHNETLVREPAKAKPKAAETRKEAPKRRIVKLEQRVTPGAFLNHNETLVRDRA